MFTLFTNKYIYMYLFTHAFRLKYILFTNNLNYYLIYNITHSLWNKYTNIQYIMLKCLDLRKA